MIPLHAALVLAFAGALDHEPRGVHHHATAFVQDAHAARAECRDWQACRELADAAAARQDFEAFHDFAWRAVQTGPKNDPALLYLLARAQSLSGRPGDAFVMLQRLAAMGVPTDAATNDDFRRVRALAAWANRDAPPAGVVPKPDGAAIPAARAPAVESGSTRTSPGPVPPAASAPAPSGAAATSGAGRISRSAAATDTLRFTTPQFTPAGLAYDAVSRRFIVGDRHARKLAVVDEFSQHVANLASAQAAGFGEIAALEIDPRLGNLWVVTAESQQTTLHKLQLVSGRSLGSYVLPERFGAARFADVATTAESAVMVLDAAGHRLFTLAPKGLSLDIAATLPDVALTSVAPAPDGLAYVAHAAGMMRVDLSSRTAATMKTGAGVDLMGITRVRWHQGSLVALQRAQSGAYSAVRITLDRTGRTATAIEQLDALPAVDPTSASISGDALYYLATGEGAEMIVRRVELKKAKG